MKTFDQLVKANNFGYKYIIDSYKPEKPKKTGKVELWHPNKVITNQEFLDYCKANKSHPATFNEVLQYTLDNPKEQLEYPLVTYDEKQLCYLCLHRDGALRCVDVDRDFLGGRWHENCRFLLVRELPLDSGTLGASGSLVSWPLDELVINGVTYIKK
jgi:hypothetical protein